MNDVPVLAVMNKSLTKASKFLHRVHDMQVAGIEVDTGTTNIAAKFAVMLERNASATPGDIAAEEVLSGVRIRQFPSNE